MMKTIPGYRIKGNYGKETKETYVSKVVYSTEKEAIEDMRIHTLNHGGMWKNTRVIYEEAN